MYCYKGKKCVTSTEYYNSNKNVISLFRYNPTLFRFHPECKKHEKWLIDVYYSYTTLCEFNNLLVRDEYDKAISLLKDFILNHEYIKNSIDNDCVNNYRYMKKWLNELENNLIRKSNIKKSVSVIMKDYAKQEIFKVSGCNLKSNYYDD